MRIEELRHKRPTTDAAKNDIKRYYDYHCIFSGIRAKENDELVLDGAHILDAGLPRFAALVKVPVNIIPISRGRHTGMNNTLDYIKFPSMKRKPKQKIEFIYNCVSYEFKDIVEEQIQVLFEICEELEVRL